MEINKIASLGNKINSAFAIHLFFLKLLRWKFQGKNRTCLYPFCPGTALSQLLSTETIQYHRGSRRSSEFTPRPTIVLWTAHLIFSLWRLVAVRVVVFTFFFRQSTCGWIVGFSQRNSPFPLWQDAEKGLLPVSLLQVCKDDFKHCNVKKDHQLFYM